MKYYIHRLCHKSNALYIYINIFKYLTFKLRSIDNSKLYIQIRHKIGVNIADT
jgi:hypothetical protein